MRTACSGQILQSEKLAAIGQLAAGVMHEINNPLATISACVAAIEGRLPGGPGDARQAEEYLEIIDKEVDRCSRIVDGLLDFSRPKAQAAGGRSSLNALVDETLFLLKHHQRFKQLQVVRDAGARPARARPGNAEQLIQVLMALMLNALDAMEQGGQLTVRTGREPGTGPTRWWSRWRTPASGIPARGPGQDLRAVLHHQAAGAGHRASASPSATASWRTTAAASRWTARPGGAPPSGSSCRCAA